MAVVPRVRFLRKTQQQAAQNALKKQTENTTEEKSGESGEEAPHATAVEVTSSMEDGDKAIQTPSSVPKEVVETSSIPKKSAFSALVTPRLVRKHAVPSSVTPSASRSDITVERLIGSRELHSEMMELAATMLPRRKPARIREYDDMTLQ